MEVPKSFIILIQVFSMWEGPVQIQKTMQIIYAQATRLVAFYRT